MVLHDWNMCCIFIFDGWEGTTHDAHIFDHALTTASMNFPHPLLGIFFYIMIIVNVLGITRRLRRPVSRNKDRLVKDN